MKIGDGSYDTWVLDSTFFHCQGDGIQVGTNGTRNTIQRVYIGRNLTYENFQAGFWTKDATDVIFSENVAHDLSTYYSTLAGAVEGAIGRLVREGVADGAIVTLKEAKREITTLRDEIADILADVDV